jgi:hypothetical protein
VSKKKTTKEDIKDKEKDLIKEEKKEEKKEESTKEKVKELKDTVEKDDNKKVNKIKRIIIILIVLLVFGGLLYLAFSNKDDKRHKTEVTVLDALDEYGYTLSDADSELFKTEFNKLKEVLKSSPRDDKLYSEQVAKLFVIDVYTMSTKFNIYDVGGNEFFYSSKVKMFEQKLIDTMYSTMEDNTYGDRKQELPEVKSITVDSVEETTYEKVDKVDGKEVKEKVDGYKLVLSWDYVKDLGYDTKGIVTVVKDGDLKYSVIEFNTVLTEEKK